MISPKQEDFRQQNVMVQCAFQKPHDRNTPKRLEVGRESWRMGTKLRYLCEDASFSLKTQNTQHDSALRVRTTQVDSFRYLLTGVHLLSNLGVWWGGVGISRPC